MDKKSVKQRMLNKLPGEFTQNKAKQKHMNGCKV